MIAIELDCGGRPLTLDRPRICGIVNATPDSFAGDGGVGDTSLAIALGLRLVEEGADLLDVGGESTRPGATPIDAQTEIARVVPVIEGLARETRVPISIDTSKPEVMRAAVAAGAGIINDVRALREDGALDAVAALGVPVILMHMQGEPRTMQDDPQYDDVVGDVHRFLTDRLFACQLAGIDKRKILVDPGFGFGKTVEHNLLLLRHLKRFAEIAPVVAGLSRKSTIGRLTGRENPADRAAGSAAAALIAVQNGASIVRVHDVAITRDALAVWSAVDAGAAREPKPPSRAKKPWDDED
jgi:dihydropteroate synthase